MPSFDPNLKWGKKEDKLLVEVEDDNDDKKQFWIMVGILCLVFIFSPVFVSEQRGILVFLGAIWYTFIQDFRPIKDASTPH